MKITAKQIAVAEEIICQQIKDLYAQQEALVQLHRQVKLLKKLGNLWASNGEPAVTFCIRGHLDFRLSRQVSEVLGLNGM